LPTFESISEATFELMTLLFLFISVW